MNNIIHCKDGCTKSMFGSISDFADVRTPNINSYAKNDELSHFPINILALLKRYPSTHLSVIDLLKIISDEDDSLRGLAVNDSVIPNHLDYYCKFFYSWFIPVCSVKKTISI